MAKKADLEKEMRKESDEVKEKIKGFTETIAAVLSQGLKERPLQDALSAAALDEQNEDTGGMADKKDASLN